MKSIVLQSSLMQTFPPVCLVQNSMCDRINAQGRHLNAIMNNTFGTCKTSEIALMSHAPAAKVHHIPLLACPDLLD